MDTRITHPRTAALGLTLAGLLVGLGGVMHPRVDQSVEFESGLAGMFETSAWTPSHALTLMGYAVLAAALAMLVRGVGPAWPRGLRLAGGLAAVAAGVAAVETLPHLLASSEAAALRRGDATPLTDLHSTMQAGSTVFLGSCLAALAVLGARSNQLDGGRIAVALAVVGGLALGAAGPAIRLTEDSAFSPLFAGAAGLAIWMVVCGIRTARRPAVAEGSRHPEVGLAVGQAR